MSISSPSLTLQTIVVAHNNLLSEELSSTEMVMMNLDKGCYYGLEEVGKTLWDGLAQPQSVSALCDLVIASYDQADRETVELDVLSFLDELLVEDLIQVRGETTVS